MRIGGRSLLYTAYHVNVSTRTGVCQVIGSIWARMSQFSLKDDTFLGIGQGIDRSAFYPVQIENELQSDITR